MRILITGGTGFIGSNLALAYARAGHQVLVVSKKITDAERENARDLKQAGVEVIQGNILDQDLMADCCKEAYLVHHIAAAMREANLPDRLFWKVNVEATQQLLELSRRMGVSRFVYCSSIGAMGKVVQKPAHEKSPCHPQDIYQITKRAAEELCLRFYQEHRMPIVIVRPADVYGPRDRRLLKLFRAIRKGQFVMIGSGQNEHHMVHVDDLVAALILAAEREAAIGEIFIIAGESPIRLEELVRMIAELLGVPTPRLRIPLAPVRALALVIEAFCKPLGIPPPLYPRRVDFFSSDYAFEISKARQMLGYQPQYGLAQGIESTLEWYRRNGLL
jgi:nucleoside-diphosphate-sugar epimerase